MTPLDDFVPEGEPIHPYDLYDLLNSLPKGTEVLVTSESPRCVDEADYYRNVKKSGTIVVLNGKTYFQTTTVPFKSKNF